MHRWLQEVPNWRQGGPKCGRFHTLCMVAGRPSLTAKTDEFGPAVAHSSYPTYEHALAATARSKTLLVVRTTGVPGQGGRTAKMVSNVSNRVGNCGYRFFTPQTGESWLVNSHEAPGNPVGSGSAAKSRRPGDPVQNANPVDSGNCSTTPSSVRSFRSYLQGLMTIAVELHMRCRRKWSSAKAGKSARVGPF
jgi:hypothetical protein